MGGRSGAVFPAYAGPTEIPENQRRWEGGTRGPRRWSARGLPEPQNLKAPGLLRADGLHWGAAVSRVLEGMDELI
jgi:hypothetical protein